MAAAANPTAPPPAGGSVSAPFTLLLVDDDPLITESFSLLLAQEYQVLTAPTRQQALSLLQTGKQKPPLALVDLGLPPRPHSPQEGLALIGDLLALNPAMKILVLSGQDADANIRQALTLGAVDFIPKPCDVPLLQSRLAHQRRMWQAELTHSAPASGSAGVAQPQFPDDMLGDSTAMQTLRAQIKQFRDLPYPVLIDGESGSGKELIARALHAESTRAARPFVALNCAALSAELLEAQLFGHAKGAFTGADTARGGFFEEAADGTLFLDEIGEFPLLLQPKLLRVLESGEYYRVGETKSRQARARIVVATNRNLRESAQSGRFREDLYHRLSVLAIHSPALRERQEDILLLLDHFCEMYAAGQAPLRLSAEARQRLSAYHFPGNVRELRNIVIRLSARAMGAEVPLPMLAAELDTGSAAHPLAGAEDTGAIGSGGFDLDAALAQRERAYIEAALKQADGNLSQAARLLGLSRTTLYGRLQKLGLSVAG